MLMWQVILLPEASLQLLTQYLETSRKARLRGSVIHRAAAATVNSSGFLGSDFFLLWS